MNEATRRAVLTVWNYLRLDHTLQASDAILVLGSHDLRVAERAVDLYEQQLAPLLIFSGGAGNFTVGVWSRPEAEMFANVARSRGVPESALLLETQSSNTGENVRFTRQLLQENGRDVGSIIAVHKPYMERRTFATICKQWPEVAVRVTSPLLDFDQYCAGPIRAEDVIDIMVGDLQRVFNYPALGYMIPQQDTPEVRAAFELLAAGGYTRHLLPPTGGGPLRAPAQSFEEEAQRERRSSPGA